MVYHQSFQNEYLNDKSFNEVEIPFPGLFHLPTFLLEFYASPSSEIGSIRGPQAQELAHLKATLYKLLTNEI